MKKVILLLILLICNIIAAADAAGEEGIGLSSLSERLTKLETERHEDRVLIEQLQKELLEDKATIDELRDENQWIRNNLEKKEGQDGLGGGGGLTDGNNSIHRKLRQPTTDDWAHRQAARSSTPTLKQLHDQLKKLRDELKKYVTKNQLKNKLKSYVSPKKLNNVFLKPLKKRLTELEKPQIRSGDPDLEPRVQANEDNIMALFMCTKCPMLCTDDTILCPDGTSVGRDPYNICEFYPCPDECLLPEEPGPCRAYMPRYYYNQDKGQCERFIYGGCGGNKNNFKTLEECEKKCEEPVDCTDDLKECPDGSSVSGNPYNDCEFYPCPKCCDPRKEPGNYGNPYCFEGHACCPDTGGWVCSIGDGKTFPCGPQGNLLYKGPFGKRCLCCDPDDEPGVGGNPICLGGHRCNPYTGGWVCNSVHLGLPRDGAIEASPSDIEIEISTAVVAEYEPHNHRCPRCCHRDERLLCVVGEAKCCPEGKWACPIGDTGVYVCGFPKVKTTGPFGDVCPDEERCPEEKPTSDDTCNALVVANKKCCYGKERCCGNHYNSYCCSCTEDNKWKCDKTDACLGAPDNCSCPEDLKKCLDGSYVSRNPSNNCEFYPCRLCLLPKDPGPCDGYFPRFYYSQVTEQCERFIYGGCLGNNNNFKTLKECEKNCEDIMVCPRDVEVCPDGSTVGRDPYNNCEFYPCPENVCLLPKDPGPCKAYFPRYYFNKVTEQCELFIYGGCQGNGNNFKTLEECEKRCEEPVDCNDDLKECPDGSYVSRNPYDDCEFYPCHKCCDPRKEPGHYGNPYCFEGHACCPNTGEWVCSIGDGKTFPCGRGLHYSQADLDSLYDRWHAEDLSLYQGPFGERCLCCDPDDEPGVGGPACIGGKHKCCPYTGKWVCSNLDGTFPCRRALPVSPTDDLSTAVIVKAVYDGPFGYKCPSDRCPDKRPYGPDNSCDFSAIGDEECCYGKETCCGKTHDLFCCRCTENNFWLCHYTDACYGAPDNCPCTDDVKECPDGSFVSRDPSNGCKFYPCPPCSLPMEVGDCDGVDGAFPRFYYNIETKQCESFIYGGCDGNANNFLTLIECQKQCEEPVVCPRDVKVCPDGSTVMRDPYNHCEFYPCKNSCWLPMDVGPCDAAIPRFYYNIVTKQCERFIYGGCGGNTNNFETLFECERKCEKPKPCICQEPNICTSDVRRCPDGTLVGRDPYNNCEFHPCAKCCDPQEEPGNYGNPYCIEGHACCPNTGEWVCSIGDGKTFPCGGKLTKGPFGKRCPFCCDPNEEPNDGDCINGKSRCCPYTGEWVCVTDAGISPPCVDIEISTEVVPVSEFPFGESCPVGCCSPREKPLCLVGVAECCPEGKWACPIGYTGVYLCGDPKVKTTGPFGDECDEGRCPEVQPARGGDCAVAEVGNERCCYGKEECCGVSYDTACCICTDDNKWKCYDTDACLGAPANCPCPKDLKSCPDGSDVSRDPLNNCEFHRCPITDVCLLPSVPERCDEKGPRFYYNSIKGICEEFTGCDGRANNFGTLEDCKNVCIEEDMPV